MLHNILNTLKIKLTDSKVSKLCYTDTERAFKDGIESGLESAIELIEASIETTVPAEPIVYNIPGYKEAVKIITDLLKKSPRVSYTTLCEKIPAIMQSNDILDKMEEDDLIHVSFEGHKLWITSNVIELDRVYDTY